MKERTIYFYGHGYNCSQCILKAAESVYGISMPKGAVSMCSGINAGLGIGSMCSVLLAGVMVFGLLFDDITTKRMRMKLLNYFMDNHESMNCCELKKEQQSGRRCESIVAEIAELVEIIIAEG